MRVICKDTENCKNACSHKNAHDARFHCDPTGYCISHPEGIECIPYPQPKIKGQGNGSTGEDTGLKELSDSEFNRLSRVNDALHEAIVSLNEELKSLQADQAEIIAYQDKIMADRTAMHSRVQLQDKEIASLKEIISEQQKKIVFIENLRDKQAENIRQVKASYQAVFKVMIERM